MRSRDDASGSLVRLEVTLDLLDQGRMEEMTGPLRHHGPLQRPPQEVEIPDQIQYLVPNQLVLEAEVIEGTLLANDDGILEGAAQGQASAPQRFDIPKKAVGPRGGNLPDEVPSRDWSSIDCSRKQGWSKHMEY